MSTDKADLKVIPQPTVPFIDLQAQRRRIASEIESAVIRVIEHGQYIMGPEVVALEAELAAFVGVRHAVTCGSGTEALVLPLMARGIGPGDAVFVPTFTFAATAEVVSLVGATPVFVDVHEDTFNIDPDNLEKALERVRNSDLRPAGLIPVDLFGLPAEYDALLDIAQANGLFVIEDAAQGFGATYRGRQLCGYGDVGSTSFFPAKPLGCYGDGGAVLTDEDELAAGMRSIREHGQGSNKYENVRIGINGRMDTIQAAVVMEKLKIFEDEVAARQHIAERYNDLLDGVVCVPRVPQGMTSVWAQYTVLVENRDVVAASLKGAGIPTAIYYPLPLHLQPGYKHYPRSDEKLTVSEDLSIRVLSLPMHPYLDEATQDRIVAALREAVENGYGSSKPRTPE